MAIFYSVSQQTPENGKGLHVCNEMRIRVPSGPFSLQFSSPDCEVFDSLLGPIYNEK